LDSQSCHWIRDQSALAACRWYATSRHREREIQRLRTMYVSCTT